MMGLSAYLPAERYYWSFDKANNANILSEQSWILCCFLACARRHVPLYSRRMHNAVQIGRSVCIYASSWQMTRLEGHFFMSTLPVITTAHWDCFWKISISEYVLQTTDSVLINMKWSWSRTLAQYTRQHILKNQNQMKKACSSSKD